MILRNIYYDIIMFLNLKNMKTVFPLCVLSFEYENIYIKEKKAALSEFNKYIAFTSSSFLS